MMAAQYHAMILTFSVFILLCDVNIVTGSRKGKVVAFFQKSCATALPNPCQQLCTNIKSGGFYCECQEGYTINKDGMTCTETKTDSHASENKSFLPDVVDDLDNQGSRPSGINPADSPQYNKDGEVVVSNNDAIHIESHDLTKGLPPLESGDYTRRLKTESGVVLDRGFYNIPEGGSDDSYSDVNFNTLDIPEGGEHSSEQLLPDAVPFPAIQEELRPMLGGGEVKVSCDGVYCENNGTCVVRGSEAVCLCPLGTSGEFCQRSVEVKYPKFLGTGYLALPVLRDAHKEFRVALEFRPESQNGLLLFSGELSDAKSDFFSVVLEDGFIVYRFDCGTGTAVLKSTNRVTLAAWNRLVITRLDNKGTVQLNKDHEVEGVSQGDYTRITFRLNLYLGGYSDMEAISSRVATSDSFVGCVQELRINDHRFDFREKGLVGESEFGINVDECSENVCDDIVCQNGGTCAAKSADQHVCLCPLGFHGDQCHKDSPVHIPHFSGHSYLEFPGLQRSVLSYTEIEIVFKPTSLDGTILYNGFSRDRKGDFISLALHDGHLEFRFDLGTGPAVIRSYEPLVTNKWHLIRASRTGLMGTLDIDGQTQRSGQSEGAYTQLTLLDGLYLGGHPNFDHTSKHANATKSFTGCLQKVVINKRTLNLMGGAIAGVNVGPCSHPCAGRPCMNGGECKPYLDTYTCFCPIGFSNTNCEDVQDVLPTKPMFQGESFLLYKDKEVAKRVSGSRMDLQIYIRPRGRDGLVFWSGEDMTGRSTKDYISLGFHAGSLQLRYNLGSGEALIGYNDTRLFDGNWHFIRVQRDKQDAYMEIDRKEIVEGSSPGGYTSLNTNKIVYLGGMANIAEESGGRFTSGFIGCIRSVKLATDYDVKLMAQAHTGRNVEQCRKKIFS